MLEAVVSGCPVIGSKNGGMSEIISNGENGWLCSPEIEGDISKVMLYVANLNDKASYVENAKKTINEMHFEQVGEKTISIYSDAIKEFGAKK